MTGGVAGFPYSSTQARGVPSDQYHVSPSRSEGSTMLSILGSETSPLDDEDRKPAARRKTKITIDRNESDLDSLFALAPEIVEVDSSTYGIFIFILPFVINNPNHLKVVIAKNGRSAKVTFTTPPYLLNAQRIAGCVLTGGKQNLVRQRIDSVIADQVEGHGDNVSFYVVLDIPFEAEAETSSDLFPQKDDVRNDAPTSSGQFCTTTYFGPDTDPDENADPQDFLHTFVLIFKKKSNGFKAKIRISTNVVATLDFGSDDMDDEWRKL